MNNEIILSEIPAGTQLVTVTVAEPLQWTKGAAIRLCEGVEGKSSDIDLVMPSPLFTKFCQALSVDLTKPFRQQVMEKSLWMCVKEVRVMHNGTMVMSRFEIFDFIPDVGAKPIISGDPCQHPKGEPLGVFLSFHELQPGEALNVIANTVESVPVEITTIPDGSIESRPEKENIFTKKLREQEAKDKIALGRKIIEKVQNKQKNAPDAAEEYLKTTNLEEDPWG